MQFSQLFNSRWERENFMFKKILIIIAVGLAAFLLLTACKPAASNTPVAGTTKVCMVTDSGGIGDKSFNDLTWAGVQAGITDFKVEGKYIQSTSVSDFASNLQACKDYGAKLIVCVGFMMADDCKAAATANPDIYYAGVDMSKFNLPNFRGVTAASEQSGYLAGYLAAAMTKTGKLGWYTGIMGPAVQNFGDGFYYGMVAYNTAHQTSVQLIGYDPTKPGQALATNSWIDADKGRSTGQSLMDEGVDIILPVCGGVGAGTAAVMQEKGSGYIFGVDQDWTQTYPQYSKQILASMLKKVDVHVYDAIKRVTSNTWEGGDYVLTLANTGVALAYNSAIDIPDAIKVEIDAISAQIVAGSVVVPTMMPIQ